MSIQYYLGLTALAVICASPTKPPVGYLAKIGPAPLRFQAAPKAREEIAPLPALAMADPEPVEVFGPPAPTNAPAVTQIAVEPVIQPVAPVAPLIEPQPAATFSPQMLMQYFNDRRGTNQDYNVVVPYQFNPPPATTLPAPPSRAIYTTK